MAFPDWYTVKDTTKSTEEGWFTVFLEADRMGCGFLRNIELVASKQGRASTGLVASGR